MRRLFSPSPLPFSFSYYRSMIVVLQCLEEVPSNGHRPGVLFLQGLAALLQHLFATHLCFGERFLDSLRFVGFFNPLSKMPRNTESRHWPQGNAFIRPVYIFWIRLLS